ncbi:hypothetical protein FQN60_007829 [Etheostoma spectabile]|uniref:Uncharacterized protein n=1 Tax=Etheostoma spectabile TaxID=54343 RepID=A0A5J5D059_9PERO|nr:hypothetical protein FQN60_007829 [Etheostoma spectabile]
MILSAFMRYVIYMWWKEGLLPPTGFLALVLSLHICDEVRVWAMERTAMETGVITGTNSQQKIKLEVIWKNRV